MSQDKAHAQPAEQAGSPGKAAGVGLEVGGVHSNDDLDADLTKYFDTIPHPRLVRLLARRISDGSLLHLLRQWLDAPIVEEERDGRRRILPNGQGVPQGGVISPLLANLYLNELDWAVNHPREPGQPVLVRYADDFVILCAPGQASQLKTRLQRWLEARGLKLNPEKTRTVHSREGFRFLGFSVRCQRSRRTGRAYAHIEPHAKSQQRLRDKVRGRLNHCGPIILTSGCTDIIVCGGCLPKSRGKRIRQNPRMPCDEAARKAGYGKSVRPV